MTRKICTHANAHLQKPVDRHPLHHLIATVVKPRHQWGFAATMLLALGGYMLMPFGSAFSVHNLGIPIEKLPMIYMATGLAALFAGPLMGRLSDAVGKYRTFAAGSLAAIALVLYYTRLGITPIGVVMAINIAMFSAISARMVSAQALASAIPAPQDRGAYMSISSSMQQLAGGIASFCAGLLVTQSGDGPLEHYERLGYVVATAMAATIVMMARIDTMVRGDARGKPAPAGELHPAGIWKSTTGTKSSFAVIMDSVAIATIGTMSPVRTQVNRISAATLTPGTLIRVLSRARNARETSFDSRPTPHHVGVCASSWQGSSLCCWVSGRFLPMKPCRCSRWATRPIAMLSSFA